MTEPTLTNPDAIELLEFLKGKTIAGLRIGVPLRKGFDLIFSDGSELELYGQPALAWATMTAAEIAVHEARELGAEERCAADQAPSQPRRGGAS